MLRNSYAILLYAQPESFKAPDGLNAPDTPISVFNLQDYVKNSGLGALVAVSGFSSSSRATT